MSGPMFSHKSQMSHVNSGHRNHERAHLYLSDLALEIIYKHILNPKSSVPTHRYT